MGFLRVSAGSHAPQLHQKVDRRPGHGIWARNLLYIPWTGWIWLDLVGFGWIWLVLGDVNGPLIGFR